MAAMLLRQHGDRAAVIVAKRIEQLASEGEREGVALWNEVVHRVDQLMLA